MRGPKDHANFGIPETRISRNRPLLDLGTDVSKSPKMMESPKMM